MHYTQEQLKKIDWTKLKLEPLDSFVELCVTSFQNWVTIRSKETNIGIIRRGIDRDWTTHDGARCLSKRQLDAIFARGDSVDTFIATEIAAIELADKREKTKPAPGDGWEYCKREDAIESAWFIGSRADWSEWRSVYNWEYTSNLDSYLFRRRIAKPAESDPGNGYEFCQSEFATEARMLNYCGVENWTIWRPVAAWSFSEPVSRYRFRRPIAQPLQLTFTHPPTLLQPNTIAIIDGVAYTVEKSVRDGNIETAELKRVQPTKPA